MKFTKMHGIGNDYVYVNCFEENVDNPEKTAEYVSDRHFGIGSDGLILIKPSEAADFYMDMYNADGSKGAMCGNGIRCVAKYVYDHNLTDKTSITIETLSGIKTLDLTVENSKVQTVKVDMGEPRLCSNNNKIVPEKTNLEGFKDIPVWETIEIGGNSYKMIAISVGNPHAVTFVSDVKSVEIEKIGPAFENHLRFPDRTNTEFVHVKDSGHIDMRVWERGSGETWACGTGACASAVACMLAGYTKTRIMVHLLGGDLEIHWNQDSGHIEMTGPATEVFTGDIEIPLFK